MADYVSTHSGEWIDTTIDNANSHISNTNNPHNVTKAQVGLGDCDNTSDANKPISTATQTALDTKVPNSRTVAGSALSADVPADDIFNAIKTNIVDMLYPVGARYVQLAGMPAPSTFGGTWQEDTAYDGKSLWVDSTQSLGTSIAQALPKPAISSTFTGTQVVATSSGSHDHTFTGKSGTTSSNGDHAHSRGTMDIKGSFGSVCAQGGNGTGAFSWKRDSSAELSGDNQSRGTLTFTASNNWSGETSTNGAHTHTITPSGTVEAVGNHSHLVTAKGSVASTVNTSGAYGTGTVVQPPAITCKVWLRTA